MNSTDLDDTARLLLMSTPDSDFREFMLAFRSEHRMSSLVEIANLYKKYRGWDGSAATHDIETGRPL